jgi:GNAT superfamily N-acetyltransferase
LGTNHTMLEVVPVNSKADLKAFMRLPWQIYRNDPQWVPPLLAELAKVLDKRKHPFHQHADSAYFLARKDDQVVGRITASVNHLSNEFHGERVGTFGFFECIDDVVVARALCTTVDEWHAERGMERVQGPMNFSTNDEFSSPGVLIDGFDTPPVIMMSHNPPYYGRLLEQCGYVKAKDLLSYWVDMTVVSERLVKGVARIGKSQNVVLRTLNMKDLDGEIARIKEIYNSAWERNWGFVPMTEAEFDYLAKSIKPIVNPRLCILAEIDGEPVGFALQLPDYNKAFQHMNGRLLPFGWAKFLWYKRNIPSTRVITMGVKPEHRKKGLDSMMILQLHVESAKFGCPRGECSWILEDNLPMRRGLERIGGTVYKTYRVYEKPLAIEP